MQKAIFNIIVLSLSLFCASSFCAAEDFPETWEFTFGTVVRISKDTVTLLEYNFDKDQDQEVEYTIIHETKFINFNALSNLRLKDEVEIDFEEQGEKRIVMNITLNDNESLIEMDDASLVQEPQDQS